MQRPTSEKKELKSQKILIDFVSVSGGVDTAKRLKDKWDKNPNNITKIISAKDFNDNYQRMTFPHDSNGVTQIYILAHCSPGAECLSIEGVNTAVSAQMIAKKLAHCIGDKEVVINLIACGAGRSLKDNIIDDSSADSFAAKLHYYLAKKAKRDIPVTARTHVVAINKTGVKSTASLDLTWDETSRRREKKESFSLVSKQPGSKVIYKKDYKNNQIRIDAYTQNWKINAIKTITGLAINTLVQEKKKFLSDWAEKFNNMNPKDIFDMMNKEVKKNNSILKKHSSDEYSLAALFTNPTSFTTIQNLIKKGTPYFTSKHTVNDPVFTGTTFKK